MTFDAVVAKDAEAPDLAAVLDLTAARSLLAGFTETTGMAAAILDLSGNVLVATGWQDACTKYHRVHPATAERCRRSDTHLSQCSVRGEFRAYKCLNGLWDVAAPLYVDDQLYGRVFIGQFFYDDGPLDLDAFARQADTFGFDKADYLAAIASVPRLSREHVDSLMRFLVDIAESLSTTSRTIAQLGRAIEEGHQALAALRNSEERFRRIVSQTKAGYFLLGTDGCFVQVNNAWLKMHGYESADEVVGQHFSLTQVEADLEMSQRVVEGLLAGETIPDGEFSHLCRDGSTGYHTFTVGPVMEAGKIVGLEGFLIDTTESRRAREEYRTLFHEMLDGFALHEIICDEDGAAVDYRFLAVNPAFERMTGLDANNIIGRTVLEVLPGTERSWIDAYGAVALSGEPAFFENYHAELDQHFEVTAFQPAPMQFACMFTDVTERKRAAEQIFQLNAELKRHSEELELRVARRTAELEEANRALESFVYSVSHDLRAPLRAISGFSEIIARRHKDSLNEEALHYFENILEATDRMGDLITDLLAYSRLGKDAMTPEAVSLRALFGEIVAEFEPKRAEVGAEIILGEAMPQVLGTRSLLWQVFSNLIDNALSYGRGGVHPIVAIEAQQEAGWVEVRVSDNGLGVAPEHHQRIFNIFQRLHSQDDRPGTGIGLAVVRKAAELMGGSVGIDSVPGEGSVFWVRLPAAESQ